MISTERIICQCTLQEVYLDTSASLAPNDVPIASAIDTLREQLVRYHLNYVINMWEPVIGQPHMSTES
jgi:hypothetical protein